jgi:hypothetical protein
MLVLVVVDSTVLVLESSSRYYSCTNTPNTHFHDTPKRMAPLLSPGRIETQPSQLVHMIQPLAASCYACSIATSVMETTVRKWTPESGHAA